MLDASTLSCHTWPLIQPRMRLGASRPSLKSSPNSFPSTTSLSRPTMILNSRMTRAQTWTFPFWTRSSRKKDSSRGRARLKKRPGLGADLQSLPRRVKFIQIQLQRLLSNRLCPKQNVCLPRLLRSNKWSSKRNPTFQRKTRPKPQIKKRL